MNRRQAINSSPAAVTISLFTGIVLVACAGDNSEELILDAEKGDIETAERFTERWR